MLGSNIPQVKLGIIAVSRDCFIISLSERRRAAIKAGEVLNMRQMRQLIIDLCNTTHPFTCPHGRPVSMVVTRRDLDKLFKRIV